MTSEPHVDEAGKWRKWGAVSLNENEVRSVW